MSSYPSASERLKEKDSNSGCLNLLIYLVFALAALSLIFIQAYQESEAFNRMTGNHTTWFDALFVELRVQDTPK
jgi:hypothetical protein